MKHLVEHLRKSRATYWLIYAMAAALLALGLVAAFWDPKYREGFGQAIDGFKYGLTASLAFLFGITVPTAGDGAAAAGPGAVNVKCPHCGKEFDVSPQLGP